LQHFFLKILKRYLRDKLIILKGLHHQDQHNHLQYLFLKLSDKFLIDLEFDFLQLSQHHQGQPGGDQQGLGDKEDLKARHHAVGQAHADVQHQPRHVEGGGDRQAKVEADLRGAGKLIGQIGQHEGAGDKDLIRHQQRLNNEVVQVCDKDQRRGPNQQHGRHGGRPLERTDVRRQGIRQPRHQRHLIARKLQGREQRARHQPDPEADSDLGPEDQQQGTGAVFGDRAKAGHGIKRGT